MCLCLSRFFGAGDICNPQNTFFLHKWNLAASDCHQLAEVPVIIHENASNKLCHLLQGLKCSSPFPAVPHSRWLPFLWDQIFKNLLGTSRGTLDKGEKMGYVNLSQDWQRRELCCGVPWFETAPTHAMIEPALSFFQLLSAVTNYSTSDNPIQSNPNYICCDKYF